MQEDPKGPQQPETEQTDESENTHRMSVDSDQKDDNPISREAQSNNGKQDHAEESRDHKDEEIDPQHKTAVLAENQIKRRAKNSANRRGGTVQFSDQHQLILVIRGMVERLSITNDEALILGRADPVTRYHPDVDLTPYGALDRGVSRGHAQLHVQDGGLYVTDLGSTNGTFLSGKRLEAHKATPIGKGDELLLGRLGIQVLFRNTSSL